MLINLSEVEFKAEGARFAWTGDTTAHAIKTVTKGKLGHQHSVQINIDISPEMYDELVARMVANHKDM